jgi:hypothetical protein
MTICGGASHRPRSAYILIAMSSMNILSGMAVVAVVALSWWILLRLRSRRGEAADASGDKGPRRFETTMGELRDLREALGPQSSRRHDRRD